MFDLKRDNTGEYICTAVGFPADFPGNSASAFLEVDECRQI